MKPAVRVVNALPPVLNNDPVPPFDIAARDEGTTVPSSPIPDAPTLRIVVVVDAPVILKTPSTFPSRSVTATVMFRFNETAADTAWLMIVCTSEVVSVPAVSDGGAAIPPGVGTAPGSSGRPPPM